MSHETRRATTAENSNDSRILGDHVGGWDLTGR
jgi:hypothetical protein